MQQSYTINDKEYSREQLIAFGKEHYPKLYWIPRVLGFIFSFVALLVILVLVLVYFILDKAGAIDPEFPTWVFFIPGGMFGIFFLVGVILIVVSCIGRSDEKYIRHAISYITKAQINNQNPNIQTNKPLHQQDIETLERYGRLLKGGVISQEEYDKKKAELLGE